MEIVNINKAQIVTGQKTFTEPVIAEKGIIMGDNSVFRAGSAVFGTPENNITIEPDGTIKYNGAATVFDDLSYDALLLKSQGVGVEVNTSESTIEFAANANHLDYLIANPQCKHSIKIGSVIYPHIHVFQNSINIPNMAFQYRWQTNEVNKVTAWTAIKCNVPAHEYVSGTLNQILHTPVGITPPVNQNLSDIIQFRIIRDTGNNLGLAYGADPYMGVLSLLSFDIHIELDSNGSREEYTK